MSGFERLESESDLRRSIMSISGSIMDSGIDIGMGCFSSIIEEPLSSGSNIPNYNKYDPLLTPQGRYSPTEFRYEPESGAIIDFTSPAKMYIEDTINSNITPFIDAVPDTMLDSLNSSAVYSPTSLTGDDNPFEVFQDLRHTSTPKHIHRVNQDNERLDCSQARKRIKFNDNQQSTSWHVLHDITAHNIPQRQSESFIKISDSFNKKTEDSDKPVIKKIPILRGNSRKTSRLDVKSVTCVESSIVKQNAVKDFLFPDRNPSVRERDKWLYYTGFTNYDLMFRVLSHISVPEEEGLSQFQILIMTFMRLKCDLDWRDLSHRFQIFEPSVFNLFHSTLSLLSYSLADVIPWTLPPAPRPNITVFLYPLPFRSGDSIKNIFIFITDARCPILYISDPVPSAQKPLSLLPQLADFFNTDDLICIKGMSLKYDTTFLKINKTPEKLSYKYVDSNSPSKHKFLKSCQETLREMRQYKLLLSKVPTTDENMKQTVSVICSVINIRTSKLVGESTLKNIHRRSYKAPCTNSSFV